MENNDVMSTKDWAITLFISYLPLIGQIMLFVWAFGSGTNPNKANFAKGALIILAIGVIFYILIFALFGAAFLAGVGGAAGSGGY